MIASDQKQANPKRQKPTSTPCRAAFPVNAVITSVIQENAKRIVWNAPSQAIGQQD